MLLSVPPLEHCPPRNVSLVMNTGLLAPLGQRADCGAAEVGADVEAAVIDEPGVDHLELAAEVEDGAAAPAAEVGVALPDLRVSVLEGDVLHDEVRPLLVETVRGGDPLLLVARVHVEDLALAATVEGDQPAAVQDDLVAGIHHLGGGGHGDGHRVRAAVEGDGAAAGDGPDHLRGGAASGCAGADDAAGVAGLTARPAFRTNARPAGLPKSGSVRAVTAWWASGAALAVRGMPPPPAPLPPRVPSGIRRNSPVVAWRPMLAVMIMARRLNHPAMVSQISGKTDIAPPPVLRRGEVARAGTRRFMTSRGMTSSCCVTLTCPVYRQDCLRPRRPL